MRAFYRGGNYNPSNSYGFASFNCNNGRDNQNTNIGFRAALPSSQIFRAYGLGLSAAVIKGPVSSVRNGRKMICRDTGVPATSGTAPVRSGLRGDWADGKALACV